VVQKWTAKLRQYFTCTFDKVYFYQQVFHMTNIVLDVGEMKETFFADTAMIGITAAMPGYRFCWLLNKYLEMSFVNDPENTLVMNESKSGKQTIKHIVSKPQVSMFPDTEDIVPDRTEGVFFPTYLHKVPHSSHYHMLYQLKNGKKLLLPEAKHLDFLWLIQTADPLHDEHIVVSYLKKIAEIQLVQPLTPDQIRKSMTNLLP
jgi:hypothetical protein